MKSIHKSKGKSIAATLGVRTDYITNEKKTAPLTDGNTLEAAGAYITNPEKTDGDLITAYECDPQNAHTDFLMSKQEYTAKTGRKYKGDVLAYHVRQSFKPGEITPEKANAVGYALAARWTKGNHAFVVATHTDKSHIHNHIIFDAVSLDCERKFRNFWGSSKALRRLSDLICIENGLSVIENPKQSHVHYGEWLENNQAVKKPTVRENLERMIADALTKKPDSFEGFIQLINDMGCEVKRGKYLSLKAPGQKKFIRLRSLSAGFSEDAIRQKIAGKHDEQTVPQKTSSPIPQKQSLLIDIQNSIKAQNSPGYERWAKTFNLKQAAKTLLFLQDNSLDELEKLSGAAQAAKDDYGKTQSRIEEINTRQQDISELQKHIGVYIKTKDVYAEYKRQKFSGKFKAGNEKALADRKAAKAHFDSLGLEKLPTMNMLKQEYAALAAEKKSLYAERNSKKSYMLEVLTAQQNVQRLLGYKDSEQAQPRKHDR